MEIGPQYDRDPAFRSRMRRHQSWWRATELALPWGTGPSRHSSRELGSMLDDAGAEAGANFITDIVRKAYDQLRGRAGIEPFRCEHNLLSSQPMCLNLFGPLYVDHELATRLIQSLIPGEVEEVIGVEIEWAPKEGISDKTSFDAFVEYVCTDGGHAFLGIETKLTEPFTLTAFDDKSAYVDLTERDDSIWCAESWPRRREPKWAQLWRNHLLVESLRRTAGAPSGDRGRVVVVYHPADFGFVEVLNEYASLLVDPGESFQAWPLDKLVDAWRPTLVSADEHAWLDKFERRYVDLALSEGAEGV